MIQIPGQYRGLRIVEQIGQRTQLIAPHNGGELTFLHPAYGPGTYGSVGLAIERANLKRPTMAETASLALAAFNSPEDNRYSKEIKDIMINAWLWAFTWSNYEPKPIDGVFVYDQSNGQRFRDLSGSELEKMLGQRQEHGVVYSDDGLLRFVPFGYNVGEMSPLELSKNAYVIALVGEEVAEKLAQVAGKFIDKPRLWSYEHVDENKIRVSALGSWVSSRELRRLEVLGSVFLDGGSNGHAFGYLK